MQDKTVEYYNENAEEYAAATNAADVTPDMEAFISYLPQGARILDTGCGSGRDSLALRSLRFTVESADGSPEMARVAAKRLATPVHTLRHQEVEFVEEFDGIWASATLLHVPNAELPDVFRRYVRALKPEGVMFASFKVGDPDADGPDDNGRHYTYVTKSVLRRLLSYVDGICIQELHDVPDSRGRDVSWLSLIIRKLPA